MLRIFPPFVNLFLLLSSGLFIIGTSMLLVSFRIEADSYDATKMLIPCDSKLVTTIFGITIKSQTRAGYKALFFCNEDSYPLARHYERTLNIVKNGLISSIMLSSLATVGIWFSSSPRTKFKKYAPDVIIIIAGIIAYLIIFDIIKSSV